jgi:hypothetical protein
LADIVHILNYASRICTILLRSDEMEDIMHKILQDKEIAVLESLKASMGPMGSWNLVEKLEEKGYYISYATIGRILNC